MYRLCLAAAVMLLALSALPVNAQTTILDMTNHPSAEGWTVFDIGPGTATTSGGILTIDTTPTGDATFQGFAAPVPIWDLASLSGVYRVEARVRLVSQPFTNCGACDAIQILAADGIQMQWLGLYTDRIEFASISDAGPYTGTISFAMDTTDGFHDYAMDVSGTSVKVYVDGILRLDATNTGATTQDYCMFGDLLYVNSSISEWDEVRIISTGVVPTETVSWSAVKASFD